MTGTLFDAPSGVEKSAVLSDCGIYRYALRRIWDRNTAPAMFVMLNPSTADAERDDKTITRCVGFARAWGYGGLLVGNLYAFRATDPQALLDAPGAGIDPVGPDNNRWLSRLREQAAMTVAAWGTHRSIAGRAADVMDMLGGLHVLRLTKKGDPGHPLYVPKTAQPQRWTYA